MSFPLLHERPHGLRARLSRTLGFVLVLESQLMMRHYEGFLR